MNREPITMIVRLIPEWDSGTMLEVEYEDGARKRIPFYRPHEHQRISFAGNFKNQPAPPPQTPTEEYREGF